MKLNHPKKSLSRRGFLKQSTLVTGSFLANPVLSKMSKFLPLNFKAAAILKVVVLGDSVMWGQGLQEEDKFTTKSVKEIGKLLDRNAEISTNFAHSGAQIISTQQQRQKYVNVYPKRFAMDATRNPFPSELAKGFINKKDENPTIPNYFEDVPSSFPTIGFQIGRVPISVATNAELVIINGGANDLSFPEFLHPENNRHDFVEHYDPILEKISYKSVLALLKQARDKFPNATIIFTGYFSPFAPNVSNDEMRKLFEDLSGKPDLMIFINKLNFVNVDQLVIEAQYRSQFGLSRGLYYTQKLLQN
jgi:lysophospholipase L1-like esterase